MQLLHKLWSVPDSIQQFRNTKISFVHRTRTSSIAIAVLSLFLLVATPSFLSFRISSMMLRIELRTFLCSACPCTLCRVGKWRNIGDEETLSPLTKDLTCYETLIFCFIFFRLRASGGVVSAFCFLLHMHVRDCFDNKAAVGGVFHEAANNAQ